MRVENYLIAIGLFSLIAVLMLAMTSEMAANYGDMGIPISIDDNQSAAFNKAAEINNLSNEMQDTLSNTPAGSGFNAFIYGAFSTVITTFKSLSLSAQLVTSTITLFGLPGPISTFIVSAIVIMLVMTLVYLVFNRSVN